MYILFLLLIYYINFFYSRKLTSQIKNDLNTHLYIYIYKTCLKKFNKQKVFSIRTTLLLQNIFHFFIALSFTLFFASHTSIGDITVPVKNSKPTNSSFKLSSKLKYLILNSSGLANSL